MASSRPIASDRAGRRTLMLVALGTVVVLVLLLADLAANAFG